MPRRSTTKEANDVVEDILALTERPTRSSKRRLEEILQEQVVEIAPEDAQTPKRGRGRPKASKIENEINSTEDKLLEDEELEEIEERKSAQKRGRKKKESILTSKPETEQISSSIIEPEVSEIESASPKRIRRKQRTLESDDDSDIVPPPLVAVDQSVASPSKITVPSMPLVVASSNSNSIHSVGNRGTGTIDTKATLPSHHSITDIAALRPPVSSDSQSISVARSVSDSNLIGSSGNVGKIAKKKREIDLNSMTAEEIEDAMMPPTSEWTAELEDKMECCQSLREGKFTQHHTIETVLDEISPEATKLHGLIKKARSTPALLAAHQETVSMGLSMNGGTFLNTINTNFRKECLSKNQSPYGEACDENGVEISNLHLAWMNAAVLEDVLIQRAAATQEVLQRMKEQQLRPSIAEACHWWGLRDAEVVEKELTIKLREDARKKQEEMAKEKEEKLAKERSMLPPPPAPGTNLRLPPPRPMIPPPVAPATVSRALPVAPTVAHIPANAPKPTGHLQSHSQQQQLLPPPRPILVPAMPSHLGYGAAVPNAPKAPTASSSSLPSGQSGYGHATNNFASSVPEVKRTVPSSSSLNLKADQGSATNGGKAHYKSSLTSSSHTKSTKSRHDHSHRSRSRSVSKNRESKRQKSKEFHSKRYREDERSRSRSSSSRHHQSHRRGRSRSRSVSPPKDDRKHDSRKEKHRDRDNSLEDHRRSKAENIDRKDRNSKSGFSNQHGSSSANKDNHRYRAQDKHEGASSSSSHPLGSSYDSGSGHHKNPTSSSASGNSHHHSHNNNNSHSNHASSTFPVAKIPPPPARPHPTHYSSSHHSNYDDHSHQRQHNSQHQHNQSYRGSHASSASSNTNSGRSHHSSSYKDHTSRR